jgi:hypothetical protein
VGQYHRVNALSFLFPFSNVSIVLLSTECSEPSDTSRLSSPHVLESLFGHRNAGLLCAIFLGNDVSPNARSFCHSHGMRNELHFELK